MPSRPIFPCFSLLGPPINSLLRGRAQKLSEVAEVDTCPRYRLSPRNLPSLHHSEDCCQRKKERKKERRQSIFAKRKKKKRKKRTLFLLFLLYLSLSLSLLRRKRKGTCSSWLRVSAYHQHMNFQVIVNMGNYTFIYLFIYLLLK